MLTEVRYHKLLLLSFFFFFFFSFGDLRLWVTGSLSRALSMSVIIKQLPLNSGILFGWREEKWLAIQVWVTASAEKQNSEGCLHWILWVLWTIFIFMSLKWIFGGLMTPPFFFPSLSLHHPAHIGRRTKRSQMGFVLHCYYLPLSMWAAIPVGQKLS